MLFFFVNAVLTIYIKKPIPNKVGMGRNIVTEIFNFIFSSFHLRKDQTIQRNELCLKEDCG